jgi:adenosylcobinamide-phosphate synthase
MNDRLIMLLGALALDLLFGEPTNALHPVVWMGRYIGWAERHAPAGGGPSPSAAANAAPRGARAEGIVLRAAVGGAGSTAPHARPVVVFLYGAALVTLGMFAVSAAAAGVTVALSPLPHALSLLAGAWLLKTTFAARALIRAARAVQSALERHDLPEARRLLSWHLVSRDTAALDEGLVAAAAVESVAENFSDSLVAPLLFFAWFGLPGAIAYRFANTADAMLGYRDARREYLGKFAARLDDLLNLVPARLSALQLLVGAALTGADARAGWHVMWRDHVRTPSPNAGWPMSTMAGVLGVTLEKVGYYRLGDGAVPHAQTIGRSVRVATTAGIVYAVALGILITLMSF